MIVETPNVATPVPLSPNEVTLPPLPDAVQPPPYGFEPGRGGFTVTLGGRKFHIESTFSYPFGGCNELLSAGVPVGEPEWEIEPTAHDPSGYRIRAAGRYYSIDRVVTCHETRIYIRDTITNLHSEETGIIISNRIRPEGAAIRGYCIGGHWDRVAGSCKLNPTIFIPGGESGIGIIALDDVYMVQSMARCEEGSAEIYTESFTLDKGVSYTLEWAIYPVASSDYYDFINTVRKDEARNGAVDGGMAFISGNAHARRRVISKEESRIRGIKYGCIQCLSHIVDDPEISVEGIEFMEHPQEVRLLREQIDAIHKENPGLKVLVHVAHALYATNNPEQTFPDSRLIDSDGNHVVYKKPTEDCSALEYYLNRDYFSNQRVEEGWRWWIYYPTLDNSFGDAMMRSIDVLLDDIGADGAFMDGFMWVYGGEYTYDRWDGHSADIDPETKTITRKKGSVLLLSQEALAAFAKKMKSRGGAFIANYPVATRTILGELGICDQECIHGPDIHLAPTPVSLGDLGEMNGDRDVYMAVRNKLVAGNLYFYYNEGILSYQSVPAQMYPITFEEIHSGYVKGKERLITIHSGLYGWSGDSDLHYTYLYDNEGYPVTPDFLTTIDSSGARTYIRLEEDETAVLKKIPVSIRADGPVNSVVHRYDSKGISLTLSGEGDVEVCVRDGEFRLEEGCSYPVEARELRAVTAVDGRLDFSFRLEGAVQVSIGGKRS